MSGSSCHFAPARYRGTNSFARNDVKRDWDVIRSILLKVEEGTSDAIKAIAKIALEGLLRTAPQFQCPGRS